MDASQHAKHTLQQLQRDIGFEATRKCESFAVNVIGGALRKGPPGQVLLKYLAVKILAIMDSWE